MFICLFSDYIEILRHCEISIKITRFIFCIKINNVIANNTDIEYNNIMKIISLMSKSFSK